MTLSRAEVSHLRDAGSAVEQDHGGSAAVGGSSLRRQRPPPGGAGPLGGGDQEAGRALKMIPAGLIGSAEKVHQRPPGRAS